MHASQASVTAFSPQNICKTGVTIIEKAPQLKKVRLEHKFKKKCQFKENLFWETDHWPLNLKTRLVFLSRLPAYINSK